MSSLSHIRACSSDSPSLTSTMSSKVGSNLSLRKYTNSKNNLKTKSKSLKSRFQQVQMNRNSDSQNYKFEND